METLDERIARLQAEQTPRALFVYGVKMIGGFWLLTAITLWGMGELLLRNGELIDRIGHWMEVTL